MFTCHTYYNKRVVLKASYFMCHNVKKKEKGEENNTQIAVLAEEDTY